MAGGCVAALCLAAITGAEARRVSQCADQSEVMAMQSAAIQQELMDAALTCGGSARENYNAFQTGFGQELRRSDRTLLGMFHRVMGYKKGDAAYNMFKTDLAAKAELRRVHGNRDFCAAANLVVAAALSPDRPSLADFVGGVAVTDITGPVNSCKMQVAVTLQGAMVAIDVVPKPNPSRAAATAPPPMNSVPETLPPPSTAPRQ